MRLSLKNPCSTTCWHRLTRPLLPMQTAGIGEAGGSGTRRMILESRASCITTCTSSARLRAQSNKSRYTHASGPMAGWTVKYCMAGAYARLLCWTTRWTATAIAPCQESTAVAQPTRTAQDCVPSLWASWLYVIFVLDGQPPHQMGCVARQPGATTSHMATLAL